MRLSNIVRYGLWAGIVATAEANRRHYHMTTTWLPHLIANTLALLLPDIYRIVRRPARARAAGNATQERTPFREACAAAENTLATIICDNPQYVLYVTPLAAGYILSHPQFNIYKGDMAEIRVAGFGLDAIPHSLTAFGFTALVCDATCAAACATEAGSHLGAFLCQCERHQALISATALALVTLIWELGEYKIYRHEMAQRGDMRNINMQWSMRDTLYDCASNLIGWGLGVALRKRQGSRDPNRGTGVAGRRVAPVPSR